MRTHSRRRNWVFFFFSREWKWMALIRHWNSLVCDRWCIKNGMWEVTSWRSSRVLGFPLPRRCCGWRKWRRQTGDRQKRSRQFSFVCELLGWIRHNSAIVDVRRHCQCCLKRHNTASIYLNALNLFSNQPGFYFTKKECVCVNMLRKCIWVDHQSIIAST